MNWEIRARAVLHIVMDGRWPVVGTRDKMRIHVIEVLDVFKLDFEP
jgi:hypothetical protein